MEDNLNAAITKASLKNIGIARWLISKANSLDSVGMNHLAEDLRQAASDIMDSDNIVVSAYGRHCNTAASRTSASTHEAMGRILATYIAGAK